MQIGWKSCPVWLSWQGWSRRVAVRLRRAVAAGGEYQKKTILGKGQIAGTYAKETNHVKVSTTNKEEADMEGKREEKTKEWKEIITRAYQEGPTITAWCRDHQISYRALRWRRYQFIREGTLDYIFGEVKLPAAKEKAVQGLLRIPAGKQTDSVEGYLVAEPIRSNLSIESMAAMLWFGLGVDYRQGESFIFISRNKQSLYALRWRAGGFDLLQRKRDRGKFRWPPAPGPEGASSLNPYVLEEVLSVLRQEASERKEFLGICENH